MASQGLHGLSDCRSALSYLSSPPVSFTALQHQAQYQQSSQNAQPCFDRQLQEHFEAQLYASHLQESQKHQKQQRAFLELHNLPTADLYQVLSEAGLPAAFELELQARCAAAQRFDLDAYGSPTQPISPLNTEQCPAAMHGLDGSHSHGHSAASIVQTPFFASAVTSPPSSRLPSRSSRSGYTSNAGDRQTLSRSPAHKRKRMESDPDCSVEGCKMSPLTALESSDDQGPQKKRLRVVWNSELQARFVKSYEELGPGAMPKSILEGMGVTTLTRENVASHLQKYRLKLQKANKALLGPDDDTSLSWSPGSELGVASSLPAIGRSGGHSRISTRRCFKSPAVDSSFHNDSSAVEPRSV